MMSKSISGFSKFSKQEKIHWLAEHFFSDSDAVERELLSWQHAEAQQQKVLDGFTENALANFPLPFSVAPNFLINGKLYAVPMVIEESSVVAAASAAAKFWLDRGGFHAEVVGTKKLGQVHFLWNGPAGALQSVFPAMKAYLLAGSEDLTVNMRNRGGGVLDIELLDFTDLEPDYYQLRVSFETCDSMGANFINSVLERFARSLEKFMTDNPQLSDDARDVEVIMSILSNYTPECRVRAWAECPISSFAQLAQSQGMDAHQLARRFATAVRIAQIDPYRATTHNKGIYNGIDAVVMATGNDFRAIEACGHTYACRDGHYRSLSSCTVKDDVFRFELEVPLAVGTVGGLTALHPLAKRSLEMLGNPSATELMMIIAVVGLAQNFGAVRSLVTTGIQQGHMKMHLTNILNHLGATDEEAAAAQSYFKNQTVSFSGVRAFLDQERQA
ncbi:MAG: hydroxymethylglutaryl-CoA reductase, degradative [Bacteroidota bacterium]